MFKTSNDNIRKIHIDSEYTEDKIVIPILVFSD